MKYLNRIIRILVIFFLMLIIFKFSNQDYKKSLSLSGLFVTFLQKNFNLPPDTTDILQFIIRKIAHFTLYFILGMLIYSTQKIFKIPSLKALAISMIICFTYACTDEIHQLFILGRTSRFLDVFIDTIGSFNGIVLLQFIRKKLKKKKAFSLTNNYK